MNFLVGLSPGAQIVFMMSLFALILLTCTSRSATQNFRDLLDALGTFLSRKRKPKP